MHPVMHVCTYCEFEFKSKLKIDWKLINCSSLWAQVPLSWTNVDMPFGGTPDHLPIGLYRVAIRDNIIIIISCPCLHMHIQFWLEGEWWIEWGRTENTVSLLTHSTAQSCRLYTYMYIWANFKMSLLRSHASILRYTEQWSLIAKWCHNKELHFCFISKVCKH